MIQQQGYGQIYGNMGAASVGASIYSAARENVTFARMVELQRLNLEKRRLRMQQAQAAANADISRQRINMENTRLQLEARRLDMVDKQNEEQRLRAEQAYEAKMQELEMRQQKEQAKAEQQAQAARLKQEQQMFDNGMEVSRAGGNIVGVDGMTGDALYNYIKVPGSENVARVPVAQQRTVSATAQGQTRGASGPTDNQAYRRVDSIVKGDVDSARKELELQKKQLEAREAELRKMEEGAAFHSGKQKKEVMDRYREEIEKKRREVEAARSAYEAQEGGAYAVAEKYRAALAEDSSLAQDVPYTKWKSLPWKEYSGEQRTTLYNLLNDGTEEGRTLLKSLVDKRDFNPWVADAWRSAKEKLGDDLAMSPDEWMRKYPYKYNGEYSTQGGEVYKEALKRDGTILMDVDYDKWKSIRGHMDEGRKGLLEGLLQSESRYDRDLLSKIVSSGKKDFNLQAAYDWQNAAAKGDTVARRIDPGVWMAVKWDTMESDKKIRLATLLESVRPFDAKLLGGMLFHETGQQALRAGVPATTEQKQPEPQAPSERKQPEPQTVTEKPNDKPSGRLDNGILIGTDRVKIVVGGETKFIPRDVWDAMTDEQRDNLQKLIGDKRKAAKGQGK